MRLSSSTSRSSEAGDGAFFLRVVSPSLFVRYSSTSLHCQTSSELLPEMPGEVLRPALLALPRVIVPFADGLVGLPCTLDNNLRRLGTVEVPSLERFRSRLGH